MERRERERERKRIDRLCRLGLVNFYVHVASKQPRITRLLISWFELKAGEATGCRPLWRSARAALRATLHSRGSSDLPQPDRLFTIGNLPFYSSSAFLFLDPRSLSFLQYFGHRIFSFSSGFLLLSYVLISFCHFGVFIFSSLSYWKFAILDF